MLERGYQVHAMAPDLSDGEYGEVLKEWGVSNHDIFLSRTGISPLEDSKALVGLIKIFKRIGPSKVLLYNIKPATYGLLAAWLAGIQERYAMITGLGYAFTGKASGKRLLVQHVAKWLYRLSLSKAKLVFFQNPDDRAVFKDQRILGKNTPTKIINGSGVDINYFSERPLPDGGPTFLMLARLLADKGVREYAKAAYQIKEEMPGVTFNLAGDFDDNPDAITREEVDTWVSDGIINYLGRIPDVRPAIEACTVYVLPSYREGTPRTVLEAMSMGRPIITTDAPGCRETVVDGVNGYLVAVASSDALIERMRELANNPATVSRMAAASRKVAVEKYDVNAVNESVFSAMGIK